MLLAVDTRCAMAALFLFVMAGCTFPTVEYEQVCAVPSVCLNDVDVCRKQAEAQQNMCASKCTTDCATCSTDYDSAIATCVAQCESCSASEGCLNATDSCKALLGVP